MKVQVYSSTIRRKEMDAVLVLNLDKEKNGEILKNYIGGATFLEMYDAFRLGKKIYNRAAWRPRLAEI